MSALEEIASRSWKSERELAVLERDAWASQTMGAKVRRDVYAASMGHTNMYAARVRWELLLIDEPALWEAHAVDRIDGDGVSRIRRAIAGARRGGEDFDLSDLIEREGKKERARMRAAKFKATMDGKRGDNGMTSVFVAAAKTFADAHANKEQAVEIELIARRAAAEIRRAAAKRGPAPVVRVTPMVEVEAACGVLRIPTPRSGQAVPAVGLQQSFRNVVKRHHPDVDGSAAGTARFKAAVSAKLIIENYNRECEGRT